MDVADLIAELGTTPSATARVTGLSRMTVQRVRDGISSPTMATLRELALAAGYDLDVSLVPASDPAAATAVRLLLDTALPSLDDLERGGQSDPRDRTAITEWLARLERRHESDPQRLLALAGRYSAPQHRTGARFFTPRSGIDQLRTIEIASSALGKSAGALSGVAAARAYLGHAPDPGPVIIWSSDADAIADRLAASFLEADGHQPAGVLVAPTSRTYFVDALTKPITPYAVVSPIQAAIDLYGLGYAGLADEITEGW